MHVFRRAVAALAMMFIAPTATAADKLFPTDVLQYGELDFDLSIGHAKFKERGSFLTVESDVTYESLSIRAGLGNRFDVGASVPYISSGEFCFSGGGFEFCDDIDSDFGDASLFTDIRLTEATQSSFSASLHLQYDTNSSGDGDDGYVIGLAGGWMLSDSLKTYATLDRVFKNEDTAFESTTLEVGLFKDIGDSVRVVPGIIYTRNDAGEGFSSSTDYGGTLSGLFRIGNNTTLIPSLAYVRTENPDSGNMFFDADHGTVWAGQLTLYSFFGGQEPPKSHTPTRKAPAATPASTPTPTLAPASAPAPASAAPAPVAESPPPAIAESPKPALEAGATLTLQKPTPLLARPRSDSATLLTLPLGESVQLKARISNETGAYWFTENGATRGWLRESDLR